MKLKPEIKYALLVLVSGVAVVILSMYVFTATQRPLRQLVEVNSFEAILGNVEKYTFENTFDKVKINELVQQVEDLNQSLTQFSREDFFSSAQASLKFLTDEAGHISSLHTQVENQLTSSADSIHRGTKFSYASEVSNSKKVIGENAANLKILLAVYKNELKDAIERAGYYRYTAIVFICVLFFGIAFITHRKFGNFENSNALQKKDLRRKRTEWKR